MDIHFIYSMSKYTSMIILYILYISHKYANKKYIILIINNTVMV